MYRNYIFGEVTKEYETYSDVCTNVKNIIIFKDEELNTLTPSEKTWFVGTEKPQYSDFVKLDDPITMNEIETILLSSEVLYVKGFFMLRRKVGILKRIVHEENDDKFERDASLLNLEGWKHDFYYKQFNKNRIDSYKAVNFTKNIMDVNRSHPLIISAMNFLRNCFKTNNKRIFSMIIIGNTKIGKSICFKNCLIKQDYIEYHNNYLEFSKTTNVKKTMIRILDDINWNEVDEMTLKALLNRNVSTVNIKYSYGMVYPLINFFLMNKEDYKIFQKKYVNIWNFISKNVNIYPVQKGKKITEENDILYTNEPFENNYLFDEIYDGLDDIEIKSNMYQDLKEILLKTKTNVYDNKQFIEFDEDNEIKIPNINEVKNNLLNDYKEEDLYDEILSSENNKNVKKVKKNKKFKRPKKNKMNLFNYKSFSSSEYDKSNDNFNDMYSNDQSEENEDSKDDTSDDLVEIN